MLKHLRVAADPRKLRTLNPAKIKAHTVAIDAPIYNSIVISLGKLGGKGLDEDLITYFHEFAIQDICMTS